MHTFLLTVQNMATGETATTTSRASDPDDACCLDDLGELPPEWGEDPEVEVVSVDGFA